MKVLIAFSELKTGLDELFDETVELVGIPVAAIDVAANKIINGLGTIIRSRVDSGGGWPPSSRSYQYFRPPCAKTSLYTGLISKYSIIYVSPFLLPHCSFLVNNRTRTVVA